MLNMMCKNCLCLNNDCNGTENQVWTGCVFKKTAEPEKESYMTKSEVHDLIDTLSNRKQGRAYCHNKELLEV